MSAGNSTRVTSTALRNAANDLRENAGQFKTQYEAILTVGKELDATWDGDANTKFMAQISGDQDQFKNMFDTLITYAEALDNSANIYDEGEAKSVETVDTRKAR